MSDNERHKSKSGMKWAYATIKNRSHSYIPNQLINGIDPLRQSMAEEGILAQSQAIHTVGNNPTRYTSKKQQPPSFDKIVAEELFELLEKPATEETIPDLEPYRKFWDTRDDKQKRRLAVIIIAKARQTSIAEMLQRIESDERIKSMLGFDHGVPSGSTISRVDQPDYIPFPPEHLLVHLRHWAQRNGAEIPDGIKPQYDRSEILDRDTRVEEKIGVSQILLQDLFSEIIDVIGFDRSQGTGNYQYPTSVFYALLAHLAIEKSHPNSGFRTFKWSNPDISIPKVETFYKYIKTFSPDSIQQKFSTATKRILNRFDFKNCARVAYDTTLIPYHGDDSNEWLVDIDPTDQPQGFGTNPADQAWRFGVISAIADNEQYILSARLLRSDTAPSVHLAAFFDEYQDFLVPTTRVIADSQLATGEMIQTIESESKTYLFRSPKLTPVEGLLADTGSGETGFRLGIQFDGLASGIHPDLFVSPRPVDEGTGYEEEDHTAYLTNVIRL